MRFLAPALFVLGAALFAAPAGATVQRTVLLEEFGFHL